MPRTESLPHVARCSALLIALSCIGCSDLFEPADDVDVYVLERVGSDALPAVSDSNAYTRFRVLADTLRLRADRTGTRTGLVEYEALQNGDGTPQELPVAWDFTFEVVLGRVEIAFVCADSASCIAPPHYVARLQKSGLRVDYALGGRVPLIYRALDD